MKQLAEQFDHRGFTYKLVERTDNAACYQLISQGNHLGYETVQIIQQGEGTANLAGKTVQFISKEKLPSNEEFGAKGFFYMASQKQEALDRLYQIEEKTQAKKVE